jgi:hypothetical protein
VPAACQVVVVTAVMPSAPTDAEGATVEDLSQQLAENPQAAVTFATTEHFNLQTERAATIGEANGRASIFLGSVSAGLVALGFAAQGGNSVATMRAFALILFPVLVFLGLSTFERSSKCRSRISRSASGSTGSAASTWRRPRACAAGWHPRRRPIPSRRPCARSASSPGRGRSC